MENVNSFNSVKLKGYCSGSTNNNWEIFLIILNNLLPN